MTQIRWLVDALPGELDDVAELLECDPEALRRWYEGAERAPRKVVERLRTVAGALAEGQALVDAADRRADAAGLPQCSWIEDAFREGRIESPRQIDEHIEACPICRVRMGVDQERTTGGRAGLVAMAGAILLSMGGIYAIRVHEPLFIWVFTSDLRVAGMVALALVPFLLPMGVALAVERCPRCGSRPAITVRGSCLRCG